jgi:hypothetical protein
VDGVADALVPVLDTEGVDDELGLADVLIDAAVVLADADADTEEDDTAAEEDTAGMPTVKIGNVLGVAAAIPMDVTDASSSAALR